MARFHELSKRSMMAGDGSLDEEWQARNVAFHEALYAACGSPLLLMFCRDGFGAILPVPAACGTSGRTPPATSRKNMNRFCARSIARDGDLAVALLKEHRSQTTSGILKRWVDPI